MTHIAEVALTPSHLALVLDYEEGGSVAEFVAQQVCWDVGGGRWAQVASWQRHS